MSGLFGGGETMESPKVAGIQLQSSSYGRPVPIVYGTARVAGNVIWYGDFTAIRREQSVGGKGGGGTTQVSYVYRAAIALGICEGPIAGVRNVWRDKDKGLLTSGRHGAWGKGSNSAYALFLGPRTQSAWSYLTTAHPTQAIGYGGTAYAAASALDLGTSGSMQNTSFEVQGFNIIGSGNDDAHPADILYDLLTNTYYGCAWPTSRIGDLTAYRTYCTACGFFLSWAIEDQKSALELVKMLLSATNSEAVWSDGKLKIVPYGDTVIGAYTPNTTPVYDLGIDDWMGVVGEDGKPTGKDPVEVERVSPADAFNCVPVQFRDRGQDYNTSVVEDPDPVDVEAFGLRKSQPLDLPMIARADVALQISRIAAQRYVYLRNRYKFDLGWSYVLLEPMDLVTITDPLLGLDHKVVRIVSIDENEDGLLSVVAEEWPFGVATATLYTPGANDGAVPDTTADPGDTYAPIILDAQYLSTATIPEIWLGAAGGPLWGGCQVHISYDDATYSHVADISAAARYGELSADLATNSGTTDNTHTLAVDLSLSLGELTSVSAQDKDDAITLCWVDGELISFENATLTGSNAYDLTNLDRGLYGTPIGSHLSHSKFARLDDAIVKIAIPPSRLGTLIYVKLVSWNLWGGGLQDISTLTPYTFTPAAATIPNKHARAIVALAGDADRGWYRGSSDPGTRGGAANIASVTITRRQWDTTLKSARLDLTIAPASDTDNLDGMRYAKIEWFRQSAAGTTGTLTSIGTTNVKLPDRLYMTPGTDADATNLALVTAHLVDSAVSSGYPACKLTIYNVAGPSDTHCFYADTGNANGSDLVDNGTSWPAGLTGASGGGTGGGTGGGGYCPAPWVPIRMANGRTVTAGRLKVGDVVYTEPESGGEWGAFRASYVERAQALRAWLITEDGRALLFATNHRFKTEAGWTELRLLKAGDRVLGSRPAVVRRVEFEQRPGPVVYIAIDGAHTYETDGLLSHNAKKRDTGNNDY